MPAKVALEEKVSVFMELRGIKENFKAELDKAIAKEKQAQSELMEVMESQDLKSFRHKTFGLITSAVKIFGKITDLKKAKEYFEEEGLDRELFQLQVKKGRLNEFVKKMLDEGKVLPEGVGMSPTKYISVTKGKK